MLFKKKVKPEKLSFSDHDYHRSGSPNENEENDGEEEDDTGSDSDQEENEEQEEQYHNTNEQRTENLADEEAEDFVMMGMDDHIAGTVRAFPRWVQIG
jgi:hypothetical protein